MRLWNLPILFVALLGLASEPADYLTPGGELKAPIEVREVQGGFAGFTGGFWAIKPDGSWTSGDVGPRDRVTVKAKGKAMPKQLVELSRALSKNDLAGLRSHGQPVTNPKVLSIQIGPKTIQLQPGPGKGTTEEDAAIRARYHAIADAVKAVCREKK